MWPIIRRTGVNKKKKTIKPLPLWNVTDIDFEIASLNNCSSDKLNIISICFFVLKANQLLSKAVCVLVGLRSDLKLIGFV